MNIHTLSLFPKLIENALNDGVIKKAVKNKLLNLNYYNLRDFGIGKHKQVDDTTYGGGPGSPTAQGNPGYANTGGGGGGVSGYATPFNSGPGGSGVVIIRYPNTRTVSSVSGGLTTSTLNGTHSSSKYTVFSAGTGTFVFT